MGVTPIVELKANGRADAALQKIHRALLCNIAANQDGVRDACPGEYLHDFRVAVRRTRTGLKQLQRVYPEDASRHFADEFRWLSQTTNAARDLEVFTASLDDYEIELGYSTIDALESLHVFLRDNERDERARCTAALESERYRSLMNAWAEFLYRPPATDGTSESAKRPIRDVAVDRIDRAYARVTRRGSDLEESSSTDTFHRLRLDCKKLRYLLEFFHDLFGRAETGRVVASLRHTQDSLGSINDLRVQAEWLGRCPEISTMAGGRLSALLGRRQREERSKFVEHFAAFIDGDTRAEVERLLYQNPLD